MDDDGRIFHAGEKEMVWSSAGVEITEFVVIVITSPIKMVLQIQFFWGDSSVSVLILAMASEFKAHRTVATA